jgi:hypothetical protein
MSNNPNESAFEYNLTLRPDGTIAVTGGSENPITYNGVTEHPPITKILKVRTVTITEAADAPWVYVNPPGKWYHID